MEVPNTAQCNKKVYCAAVMLSEFSTRLKLILPVLHTAEGNILYYGRGAQNTDNLSLLYRSASVTASLFQSNLTQIVLEWREFNIVQIKVEAFFEGEIITKMQKQGGVI
jgi:hypothetical protein